jgi:uncharacterized protein
MAATSPSRIVALDVVRGAAVMGILAMNIVAFAMPLQAYFNPFAYGADSAIDIAAYAFNFVLVDGKMRGLFTFLFGASMLLVIELAEAKGQSAASVTYRRQIWLLVFGAIHFYLIWFGDILMSYALIGMIAFFFRRLGVGALVAWGSALLLLQLTIVSASAAYAHSLAAAMSGPAPGSETVREWKEFAGDFAVPSAAKLQEIFALHLGPWTGIVREQVTDHLGDPFLFAFLFGPETLAYMLFGMAALKSGFLAGAWADRRYEWVALIGLGTMIPVYAIICWVLFADGFTVPGIFTWYMAATIPFRPVMVVGYAALIIVLTRNGGWLVERIAAAGRAAFTNYLGTSIVMTGIFYGWGLGLYGALSRAELWLVVLAMWVVMLLWSKPWLDRFRYGPIEWLWRSLARWELQPMRKRVAAFRGRRGLDPPEALVGGLAAEAGTVARQQRVGRLVEQLDGPLEHPAKLDHVLDQLVREAVGFDAEPRRRLDQLGDLGERLGAELAGFALERMRRNHERAVFCSRIACSIWPTDLMPSSRK